MRDDYEKRAVLRDTYNERPPRGSHGLEAHMQQPIMLMCSAYIYYGRLIGLGLDHAVIENAHIVYETGEWTETPEWRDHQALPNQREWAIGRYAIESFAVIPPTKEQVKRLNDEKGYPQPEPVREHAGLEAYVGQTVLLLCSAYIYHGKLIDVPLDSAVLEGARIVYETGPWDQSPEWKDAQPLPNQKRWSVGRYAIESFAVIPPTAEELAKLNKEGMP